MERTEVLDLMGSLKLFGMRTAYDETLSPWRSSASTNRSASSATS